MPIELPSMSENSPELCEVSPQTQDSGTGVGKSTDCRKASQAVRFLEKVFGRPFAVFSGEGLSSTRQPKHPPLDWDQFAIICRVVARRQRPEFIWEEDPLLFLAVPLPGLADPLVAVAPFVIRNVSPHEDLTAPAEHLGCGVKALRQWVASQHPWTPEAILQVARACRQHFRALERLDQSQSHNDELAQHLATVYEEIGLLHRLTRNLRLSRTDEDLARIAIQWLSGVVPAEAIGLVLLKVSDQGEPVFGQVRTEDVLLTTGSLTLSAAEFCDLMDRWGVRDLADPFVWNLSEESRINDRFCLRNVVAAPVAEGQNIFGFLAAFNHREGGQFGTTEANLLHSVATIIGVHSSNLELYRQQSELLAGVLKALTAAVDAKDPYTCGHSDRVARLAVRLAQELGFPAEKLSRVYLAGLLHDIGKIGVNDSILQKPAALTAEEYNQVKLHAEKGHRILCGLRQFEDILPAVLHHHEAWDGSGYPAGLVGENIPLLARIVAVADAYDAMASDRPYRRRLPEKLIEQTLREGAGRQWDPQVIEAFFRARRDLRKIATKKDHPLLNHPILGPILRNSLRFK